MERKSAPVVRPGGPAATDVSPTEAPKLDPAVRQLEEKVKEMELSILEKDSLIQDLKARGESQQRLLDEAIQEVVRAKAKLLSLDSRAEAASQMAETEIALKTFEGQSAGGQESELQQMRQLLQMGSKEFENENFGGALYLTVQAKSRIQAAQVKARASQKLDLGSGEIQFAVPLALKVARSSNVRSQPDVGASLIVTLSPGTPVTGYSHNGEWVRVVLDDGTRGWIHQSLLSAK